MVYGFHLPGTYRHFHKLFSIFFCIMKHEKGKIFDWFISLYIKSSLFWYNNGLYGFVWFFWAFYDVISFQRSVYLMTKQTSKLSCFSKGSCSFRSNIEIIIKKKKNSSFTINQKRCLHLCIFFSFFFVYSIKENFYSWLVLLTPVFTLLN